MTEELIGNETKNPVSLKKVLTKEITDNIVSKVEGLSLKRGKFVYEVDKKMRYKNEFIHVVVEYKPIYAEIKTFKKNECYVVTFSDLKSSTTREVWVLVRTNDVIKETFNNKIFKFPTEYLALRKKEQVQEYWKNTNYSVKRNQVRQIKNNKAIKEDLTGKLKLNENLLSRYQALFELSQNEASKLELMKVIDKLEKNITYCKKHLNLVEEKLK